MVQWCPSDLSILFRQNIDRLYADEIPQKSAEDWYIDLFPVQSILYQFMVNIPSGYD